MIINTSTKPIQKWITILAISMATTMSLATAFYLLRPWLSAAQGSSAAAKAIPTLNAVTALGRLEPQGDVIQLSASSAAQSNRVAKLLVEQGDKVHVGQAIAILDSHDRLMTTLEQAQAQVKVAQAHLAQVQAGAKPVEITAQQANINSVKAQLQGEANAQEATIAQLEPEQRHAQIEYQRYLMLYQNGAISASALDSKRLAVETLKQQIAEARTNQQRTDRLFQQQTVAEKAALNALKQVRPADVQEAQAEVEKAIIEVKQAQANLDFATMRSPIDGQVLKIHTQPGEVVSDKGQRIVELGQTDQMYAVAEVYESDIAKVRLGQKATLTSQNGTLPKTLHGTVEQIGLQIGKK
ncbi:MAG: HlyD family efflux transporter periplasmic adaptor subunit, partial [Chroococcidiopsidaceae cyanobacterium CP_BM_ER_R8_30]|nr:HlyD family efflux transporter periplasmic adaptor subunit [Chroococcidiopsidaceae cyanobacterium CP_BM_ER_R8_30]